MPTATVHACHAQRSGRAERILHTLPNTWAWWASAQPWRRHQSSRHLGGKQPFYPYGHQAWTRRC